MMRSLHKPTAIALSISFLLTSCAGVLDLDSLSTTSGGARMAPPLIVDGAGNLAPELSQSQVSPVPPGAMAWSPAEETREWHGAVSQKDCDRVEKALKDKGLDVDLVDIEATGNPQMPWACIFDGQDADPDAARFPDERSENRDESEYP
jgi:hypothetical protein